MEAASALINALRLDTFANVLPTAVFNPVLARHYDVVEVG